jgi:protein-disulfide isomerase
MSKPKQDTPVPATPPVSRRHVLLGAVAVAAIAVAGGGYYVWSHGKAPEASTAKPTALASATPTTDGAGEDLMAPGPLGEQSLGNANAPVTVIEYASMTCPHCAHFHETVYPEFKKTFIDTGKVRFIFREFPLDPLAAAGFMLARCGDKDKFFPMIETLFAQQKDWVVQKPLAPLLAIAKQAGFTQESFDACLANQKVLDGIEEVRTRASQKFQVTSTPTFFVNGKILRGAPTMEELTKQIEPLLKT